MVDLLSMGGWVLDRIVEFVGSSFFGTLVAGGFGAYAGAGGAQLIVDRNKSREELLTQIKDVNSALMVTFSITNSFLGSRDSTLKSWETVLRNSTPRLFHLRKSERKAVWHPVTNLLY